MKRKLTLDDALAAVWGGAILGGGGGGFVESGERTARLALQTGPIELWSADEFPPLALAATVALVGAPSLSTSIVRPEHLITAVDLLRQALPSGLVALYTNENGADTTINGWLQAAALGLPVMDLACNGRAHPTGLMGAMGLHADAAYQSVQAFAGGTSACRVEGVARGHLAGAASIVRHASVEAGGVVAVARNPVTVEFAVKHGAPGAITFAIELGRVYLDGGVGAVARFLEGKLHEKAMVARYECKQTAGLDIGVVGLDDALRTELPFINEFMLLEQEGRRVASFPDLLTIFRQDGKPTASADLRIGDMVQVLHVPASRLPLSRTMYMPELYQPLENSLGKAIFHRDDHGITVDRAIVT